MKILLGEDSCGKAIVGGVGSLEQLLHILELQDGLN